MSPSEDGALGERAPGEPGGAGGGACSRSCNCLFSPETLQHIKMNPSVNLLSKLDYCSFASWKSCAIKKSRFLHGELAVRYLAILQLASQK